MTEPESPGNGRKRHVAHESTSGTSPTTDDSDIEDNPQTESRRTSHKREASFDSQQSSGEKESAPSPKRINMPRSPAEYSSQPYMSAFPPDNRLFLQSHSQPDPAPDESMTSDKPFSQLLHDIWRVLKTRMIEVAADVRVCRPEFHPIFSRNKSFTATYD